MTVKRVKETLDNVDAQFAWLSNLIQETDDEYRRAKLEKFVKQQQRELLEIAIQLDDFSQTLDDYMDYI